MVIIIKIKQYIKSLLHIYAYLHSIGFKRNSINFNKFIYLVILLKNVYDISISAFDTNLTNNEICLKLLLYNHIDLILSIK